MIRARKTKILVISIPLILVGLVLVLIKSLNSPAEGTITKNSVQNQSRQKAEPKTGIYDGKLIRFAYPAGYEKVGNPKNSGYLEVVNYFSTDHTSTHLAVTVVAEDLANDPGYNLRKSHPETYRLVLSSPTEKVFTSSKDGSEQTEYLVHGGMVASISMTVPGTKDLSKDFAIVSNSLQWRQ